MIQYVRIKILQWNVWYKENVQRVLDELKRIDADIVCLQELTHGYVKEYDYSTWEYIAHNLNLEFCYQEIPIIRTDTEWLQANAIFSKYKIVSKKMQWLHTPADDKNHKDQYRGYLEAALDLNGRTLSIGTTHMSFGTDPDNDKELQRLLSVVKSHKKDFILAGDLNVTPDSRRIKELSKYLNHAGPSFGENTWTNKPFDLPEFKASTLDWRYDYIFATKDINTSEAKIIKTDVSDHLPVEVMIDI
jgi:endonuclease/exonuclease/phosphatase family metal-dependent hydrolase